MLVEKKNEEKKDDRPQWKLVLMVLGGLVALCIGGQWVVNGAITIARKFGMSEFMISVTIISIGTSLPELCTSVVADLKKEPDIAVGNVVGSNIFNILLILGISAFIRPLPISPAVNIDIGVTIGATLLLLAVMVFGKDKLTIERREGAFMLLAYIGYIVYVIIRG